MGFLSDLFKKAKPLLPFLLPMVGSGIMGSAKLASLLGQGGKLGWLGSAFSGMNPMARNMLMQSAMGYGTAALSGSKRPGKAAMYAGLASIPFSYMSAAQGANAYNQQFADVIPEEMGVTGRRWMGTRTPSGAAGGPYAPGIGGKRWEDITGMVPKKGYEFQKMTPWDVLKGSYTKPSAIPGEKPIDLTALTGGELPGADIFSKTTPLKQVYDPQSGASVFTGGEQVANWLPTAASQAAALYGGRMTPEEEWEESQKKRKKELAWMYGVPEEMIEGEMTNPWATGGGFWNKGGIASLENGGGVSGPGTGTSDSINANLSDGEFVMTAKAVENLGGGDRYAGARQMYDLMNVLDPESETMSEVI